MSYYNLWAEFQSGFREKHSTETALIKVINNLLLTADSGHLNILILLDLTAAFDTVCHTLQLVQLETLLGITGTPLSWFKSYLTARQQFVSISSFKSPTSPLSHSAPKGSVLNPLLFIIYILTLGHIIRRHGLNFHCYADDTQLYIHTKPSDTLPPSNLTDCLHDINNWINYNYLRLNQDKSEAILIASPATLRKISHLSLSIPGFITSSVAEVRNLGIILDFTLCFN